MGIRTIRRVALTYLALLTLLLLVRNPLALIRQVPPLLDAFLTVSAVTHLMTFTVLAFLMLASRWPVPGWRLFAYLAAYACATEGLQYFFPPRKMELVDVIQDLLGLALGAVLWSAVEWWQSASSSAPGCESSK